MALQFIKGNDNLPICHSYYSNREKLDLQSKDKKALPHSLKRPRASLLYA